jgi:hypothetical protein
MLTAILLVAMALPPSASASLSVSCTVVAPVEVHTVTIDVPASVRVSVPTMAPVLPVDAWSTLQGIGDPVWDGRRVSFDGRVYTVEF